MRRSPLAIIATLASLAPLLMSQVPATGQGTAPPAEAWRSALYPTDWTPAYRQDPSDTRKFLHDFSYAGYAAQEAAIPGNPAWAEQRFNVIDYGARPGDGVDDTAGIQAALDAAAANRGGTVFVPPGTYHVAPVGPRDYALWLHSSHTILEGVDSAHTRIVNTAEVMRDEGDPFGKAVIRVGPTPSHGEYDEWWYGPRSNEKTVTADVPTQATQVEVSDTAGLEVGDWVVVRGQVTESFVADHDMTGYWDQAILDGENVVGGPVFYRQVERIDDTTLTLDIPLRYAMPTTWDPVVYQVSPHIEKVGVEGISLGMVQNTVPGLGSNDYSKPGTGAYQIHSSTVLTMERVVDGWVRDLSSFRPNSNSSAPYPEGDFHVQTKGVELNETRNVTVENVSISNPQYRGAGGNGYLMQIKNAQENLISESTFTDGRHNVTFDRAGASGNVVHRTRMVGGSLQSDFHRYLSMSNLWDQVWMDGDCLNAVNRGHSSLESGHTTTESVFWNVTGGEPCRSSRYLIESAQFAWGYVVGTRSDTGFDEVATTAQSFTRTDPPPTDLVEGIGRAADLEPQSLFLDQRARRLR